MSIDNPNAKIAVESESSEHLLTGIFTPGDKQPMEQLSTRELLQRNELLIAEVSAQANRIAAAACKTLNGMPESYRDTFFQGISCFNDPNDIVWNSLRQQWNGSDVKAS
jgi:hypothetical protein